MNYGKIIYFDTANARGLSTVLFVSGCENYCENC
jgi:pyruvate-formate lyase-activating enzyme